MEEEFPQSSCFGEGSSCPESEFYRGEGSACPKPEFCPGEDSAIPEPKFSLDKDSELSERTIPKICKAAEEVKRLLGRIEMRLMSDFNICAPNARNQRVPIVDMMTLNVECSLDDSYTELLMLEGHSDYRRLAAVKCLECGLDCLNHSLLDQHITELHNPFCTANSPQPSSFACPVPWCLEMLPCPASRRLHACLQHGFLSNSPIFSVLRQT